MDDIQEFLDPTGYNIAFKSMDAWRGESVHRLSDPFKSKVVQLCLDPENTSFLELLKSLRNVLAHGSENSKMSFNESCRSKAAGAGGLGLEGASNLALVRDGNAVRDIGKYLRSRPVGNGKDRIEVIHRRLISVSDRLRTS